MRRMKIPSIILDQLPSELLLKGIISSGGQKEKPWTIPRRRAAQNAGSEPTGHGLGLYPRIYPHQSGRKLHPPKESEIRPSVRICKWYVKG